MCLALGRTAIRRLEVADGNEAAWVDAFAARYAELRGVVDAQLKAARLRADPALNVPSGTFIAALIQSCDFRTHISAL